MIANTKTLILVFQTFIFIVSTLWFLLLLFLFILNFKEVQFNLLLLTLKSLFQINHEFIQLNERTKKNY